MNKPLLTVACALLASAASAQTTLHVSPDGRGDGSKWSQAASLHDALSKARAGDQLWLEGGTYLTSATGDRDATFAVPSGVAVYGGFAGKEGRVQARKPQAHPTVLSGEIGGTGRDDNAYTVLTLTDASSQTLVDGVVVERAYADGAGPTADARRAGGGVLVNTSGPGLTSSPILKDVVFRYNFARDGGAVYNDGRRHGIASPKFTACRFEANVANYGAALFNQATKGTTQPVAQACIFKRNRAYVRGASLYTIDNQGDSDAELVDCVFDDRTDPSPRDTDLARGDD